MSQELVCRCKTYECCPICDPAAFQREVAKRAEPIPAGVLEETLAQALADAAANFRVALDEYEMAEYHEKNRKVKLDKAMAKLEEAEKHLTNYLTEKETHHEQT